MGEQRDVTGQGQPGSQVSGEWTGGGGVDEEPTTLHSSPPPPKTRQLGFQAEGRCQVSVCFVSLVRF